MIEQLSFEKQEEIQKAADRYSNLPNVRDRTNFSYIISATAREGFIAGIEWILLHKEDIDEK